MKEGGTASQIANDEKRLFDRLSLMSREKDVIEKEAKPMDQRSNRPDGIEHQKKEDALACQMGGGVFGGEKGAIGGSPEEVEIIGHTVGWSLPGLHKKSPLGLSQP